MRLIDADALLDDIRSHSASYFADDFAREWVDKQPTVDVDPVIRCKDCKHFLFYKFGLEEMWEMRCGIRHDDYGYLEETTLHGYCHKAERKEG